MASVGPGLMFVWPEPNTEFTPSVVPSVTGTAGSNDGWYFVFRGNDILQTFDRDGQWQPAANSPEKDVVHSHYLGDIAGKHCHAIEVSSGENFAGLRSLFGKTDHLMFGQTNIKPGPTDAKHFHLKSHPTCPIEWHVVVTLLGRHE